MKKKIVVLLVILMTVTLLVACESSTVEEVETISAEIDTVATEEQSEDVHEHSFTETITKEATCLEAGEKTLTCECGETKVEEIPATGHDFSSYVSNEDATYEANGTETATCGCGETDTRVAEGSMLAYSFEEMDGAKYAKSTVNVRSFPNSDSEKVGSLSTNDEVKVTGKCNETGWYRIEYADGFAYVSDEYLVDEKVEVATAATDTNSNSQSSSNGYKIVYEGKNYAYVDAQVSSYSEARAIAYSLGYDIWNPHVSDNTGFVYTMACHMPSGADMGNIEADCDAAVMYFFNNGYSGGGVANVTDTKDGRLFIGKGHDWSIDMWVYQK